MSGMILRCNIGTKVCSQIGRKWDAMIQSNDFLFSNWRLFEQFAFVINHLLCYWPAIHNSISKICPDFQVPSSHFSENNVLLDEHWADAKWKYYKPLRQHVSKLRGREFWYIVSGLDIQLEQFENHDPARKKSIQGCGVRQVMYRFLRLIDTNSSLSG